MGNFINTWVSHLADGNMSVVSMDGRGRVTLPTEMRSRIDAKKFVAIMEGETITLIPIPDPEDAKGSVEIPWSIEELEEAGENYVPRRA